jgi:phosphatidylglycerophosphate synthase
LFFIVTDRLDIFRWLLIISFITDAADGYLARRFKVSSVNGSRLDSISDDATILMALIALIVFRKTFMMEHLWILLVLFGLYLIQNSMALLKYKRLTSFHTWLAKTAAILQGIFLILVFFLTQPPVFLFYAAAIVTMLDLCEEIALVIILPQWKSDVKGLYEVEKFKGPNDNNS